MLRGSSGEPHTYESFFTGTPSPGLEAFQAQFQTLKAQASPDTLAILNQAIGGISQQPAPRDNVIQKTQECVWNADDRDIPILNQADDHNFENDTIFHAFCLLRRLAIDIWSKLKKMDISRPEIQDGTRYHSKAIRALKWLGERPLVEQFICKGMHPPNAMRCGLRTRPGTLVNIL